MRLHGRRRHAWLEGADEIRHEAGQGGSDPIDKNVDVAEEYNQGVN